MLIFLTVEVLVSSPTTTVTIGDPSVNLSCELYGYLMRQPSIIMWNFGNEVLMDDSVFTITVQDGSHMIQNGGDTLSWAGCFLTAWRPAPERISALVECAETVEN